MSDDKVTVSIPSWIPKFLGPAVTLVGTIVAVSGAYYTIRSDIRDLETRMASLQEQLQIQIQFLNDKLELQASMMRPAAYVEDEPPRVELSGASPIPGSRTPSGSSPGSRVTIPRLPTPTTASGPSVEPRRPPIEASGTPTADATPGR